MRPKHFWPLSGRLKYFTGTFLKDFSSPKICKNKVSERLFQGEYAQMLPKTGATKKPRKNHEKATKKPRNKGLYTRRHDRVRDHIALVARQAGLTAQIEQTMFVPGQTLDDGRPAPGSVRPIHRADLHIIEPTGSELWLDVRIHTVAPDLPVTRELLREEQTKCRSYGQRHGYDLNQLDQGMIPVVLEQYGRTAPGAHAIFQRLIHHRTQLLVRQGLAPYSQAKRQASAEMWVPLACLLLRAAWQSIAECMPTQATARPSMSSPAGPDSHPAGLDDSRTRSDVYPARLDLVSSRARPEADTFSSSELSTPGWQRPRCAG